MMFPLLRFIACFSTAALFFVGTPLHTVSAQQIRQPASVLPWKSATPEVGPQFAVPHRRPAPAWLTETSQSTVIEDLPMVEKESFAHIGELPVDRSSGVTRRGRNPGGGAGQSFNLLRALGIGASGAKNRR